MKKLKSKTSLTCKNKKKKKKKPKSRINPRRNTSRHILIKLTKIKHKEKILKATREKEKNNT